MGRARGYYRQADIRVEELAGLLDRQTTPGDCPSAMAIERNVPIYDGAAVAQAAGEVEARQALMAEWATILAEGAGIVVIRGALPDGGVVDGASRLFEDIIVRQNATGTGGGDHFAKPGANDRIWNALEKHALADPENFVAYYASPAIALASESWLGPGYQMTAQVNCVNPGGAAQSAHRDYHLGFMTGARIERYPAHVHALSPGLTLQGAIAHCDMPLESGPTMLLPFSQTYGPGYVATADAGVKALFAERHVQLPLARGDALFFNPAVIHAAGHNRTTDVRRMANLLQVSSAFGRAMESVDRLRVTEAVYPALLAAQAGGLDAIRLDAAIAAAAEGYAFPTNLDSDPPIGGLAPETPADLVRRALAARLPAGEVAALLRAQAARRPA